MRFCMDGGTSYLWQVRLDPLSAETYADMGTAYLARRELLASQREYELALQLQPANALAHANLVASPATVSLEAFLDALHRSAARAVRPGSGAPRPVCLLPWPPPLASAGRASLHGCPATASA